ncbi:MAG: hypothetical protein HQ577_00925 [Dehalococcoidia bacterium]|nr:hypothetical protein [Dehalococcoidia bacterium]
MRYDQKIALAITLIIITLIIMLPLIFGIDVFRFLGVLGFFCALILPLYIQHRIESNRQNSDYLWDIGAALKALIDDIHEVIEQIDSSIEELGAYIQDIKDWEKEENNRNLASYKKEIRGLEDADELLREYIKVQKFDSILPGYRSGIKNMKKMSHKLTTIKYDMDSLYRNRGLYHGVLIPYP